MHPNKIGYKNMNTIAPTISNSITDVSLVDALWTLIQSQTKSVRKALAKRILEENTTKAQQKMVKESLTKAIEELHTGKAKHNARALFTD